MVTNYLCKHCLVKTRSDNRFDAGTASPGPRKILEGILAEHQFTSAGTPGQAATCLQKVAFDPIIGTVMFNEHRMFDFLRRIKDREEWERIPFICAHVISKNPAMSGASGATRFAAKQLGAVAFLDILDYRENPQHEMRMAIESCLMRKSN